MAPWTFRNYIIFNKLIPVTSNSGLELWIGNHAGASGGLQDDRLRNTDELPENLRRAIEGLNEPERYQYLGRLAFSYILANPLHAMRLRIYSFLQFWFGDFHWRRPLDIRQLILGYGGIVTILLGWAGLWKCFRVRWGENRLFLLIFIGLSMIYTVTHGGVKYRDGLFPIISIYVGNLLLSWYENIFHAECSCKACR